MWVVCNAHQAIASLVLYVNVQRNHLTNTLPVCNYVFTTFSNSWAWKPMKERDEGGRVSRAGSKASLINAIPDGQSVSQADGERKRDRERKTRHLVCRESSNMCIESLSVVQQPPMDSCEATTDDRVCSQVCMYDQTLTRSSPRVHIRGNSHPLVPANPPMKEFTSVGEGEALQKLISYLGNDHIWAWIALPEMTENSEGVNPLKMWVISNSISPFHSGKCSISIGGWTNGASLIVGRESVFFIRGTCQALFVPYTTHFNTWHN